MGKEKLINRNHLSDDFTVKEQDLLELVFKNQPDVFEDEDRVFVKPERLIEGIIDELNESAKYGDLNFKYQRTFRLINTAWNLINKLADMK